MNISVLTDPNPKNYLDINCHNINCNSLQANDINFSDLNVNNITCDSLLANSISCVDLDINGNYTLPGTAPDEGQIITLSGGNMVWKNLFDGFQAQRRVSSVIIAPTASTRNICNVLLAGTNYNTTTFTYSTPVRGIYEFTYTINWSWTSTVNPSSGQCDTTFIFNDGAGDEILGYVSGLTNAAAGTSQLFRGINTITLYKQLNTVGATVQISVANNSSANDISIDMDHSFFGGRLIQEF